MDIVSVRQERPEDAPAIAQLILQCYQDIPYSQHREHLMVERLRRSQAYVPELALVAHIGDQLAGHIMLTRIKIRHEQDHSESLSLAPLSVGPAFQRKGVGRALIEGAHQRARALHFASVIIVGISGYYDRFGYRPLNNYPIHLPFGVHPDNCMAIALLPSGLDGVKGTVEYAPEWMEK